MMINKIKRDYGAIIGLGKKCQTSFQLNRKGLRVASLPFDWIITDNAGDLASSIANHFHNWFNLENLVDCQKKSVDRFGERREVFDELYHNRFIHSFFSDASIKDGYSQLRVDFNRRIKKFYDLLDLSNDILFIRTDDTTENAICIMDAIRQVYKRHFSFLLVNHSNTNIPIETTTNYENLFEVTIQSDEKDSDDWMGNDEHWDIILDGVSCEANKTFMNYRFQEIYQRVCQDKEKDFIEDIRFSFGRIDESFVDDNIRRIFNKSDKNVLVVKGLDRQEDGSFWITQKKAIMYLKAQEGKMVLRYFFPAYDKIEVRLSVKVNGNESVINLEKEGKLLLNQEEIMRIDFQSNTIWNPGELLGSVDSRNLVCLLKVEWENGR